MDWGNTFPNKLREKIMKIEIETIYLKEGIPHWVKKNKFKKLVRKGGFATCIFDISSMPAINYFVEPKPNCKDPLRAVICDDGKHEKFVGMGNILGLMEIGERQHFSDCIEIACGKMKVAS